MTEESKERGQGVGRMSRRVAAWLAWSMWALCVALAVLALGFDIYTPPTGHEPNFAVLA
jgi:hypothetical protein